MKAIKKWWRIVALYALLGGVFFMLAFVQQYHWPRLKTWMLLEVEKQSQAHSPVRLWPKDLELHLFPLGISLTEVRLLPQHQAKKILAPTIINRITASLSFIDFLRGQFRLSRLELSKAELKVIIDEPLADDKSTNKKINLDWDWIYALPVEIVSFKDFDFYVRSTQPNLSAKITKLNLEIENKYKAIKVDISTESIRAKNTDETPILDLSVKTEFLLEEDGVYFSGLQIKRDQSFIVAAGSIKGNTSELDFTEANLKTRSQLSLSELLTLAKEFFPDTPLPEAQGRSELDLEIQVAKGEDPNFKFDFKTQDVFIEGYEVGDASGEGQYSNKKAEISQLAIRHSGGTAVLHDAKVTFGEKVLFTTDLEAKKIDLYRLLKGLKIDEVPVYSEFTGQIPCLGEVYPVFSMQCKGSLNVDSLDVTDGSEFAGESAFNIVNFKGGQATGQVSITAKDVKYQAKIKIGNSTGSSSGVVDYQNGFNIDYAGDEVFFSDLQNLAQLKFSGKAVIRGNTKGNSSYATINLLAKTTDFKLEDFNLGKASFNLRYKKGILGFRDLSGSLGSSRYKGHFSINLLKQRLYLAAEIPYFDADDLKLATQANIQLPVTIAGTGSAKIKLSGPLQTDLLSYELESALYRGTIANESFDQLTFNVDSKKGIVETKNVQLTKSQSRVNFRGRLDRAARVVGTITGERLRLEQSENLSKLKLKMGGQLDFRLDMKGPITNPDTIVSGKLTKMTIGDQPTQDSSFQLNLTEDKISGNGTFIGDVMSASFLYPLKPGIPFEFNVESKNWDFTRVFSIFSSSTNQSAFQTRLTGKLKVFSKTGMLKDIGGNGEIEDFEIRRGPLFMRSSKPMYLALKDNTFSAKNCVIRGKNTFLELKTPDQGKDKLNLDLNGKVDMTFLNLVAPFLDDIRGDLSLSVSVAGKINDPNFIGSAYVQDAVIKLKDFPHPIEQLSADLLFSQKNALLNSLRAKLGNGDLTAGGSVQINGLMEIPVLIQGELKNASLNVPTGFRTLGSGRFSLKGDWFPYLFEADYLINSGKVSQDFSPAPSAVKQIQPSSFLPKFLQKDSFEPITLDTTVRIEKDIPVSMKIVGAAIDTPIRGQINIKGLPSELLLTGRLVTGTEGKVTFRSNIFELRNGQILFNNVPPDNPSLLVDADTRVNDYDISLHVEGPAKKPVVSLLSQPPLPEAQIASLLALGVLSEDDDDASERIEFGTGIIADQFGFSQKLRDNLGLDFDITSSIDTEGTDSEHTVTIKKQWSPKFGASAGRSFGKETKNNVKIEYRLNRGLSVVGTWLREEPKEASSDTKDTVGVDLEYKIEFK